MFAANVKVCKSRGYHALKTTLPLFYGEGNREDDRNIVNGSGYSGTQGTVDSHWKETEFLDPLFLIGSASFLSRLVKQEGRAWASPWIAMGA